MDLRLSTSCYTTPAAFQSQISLKEPGGGMKRFLGAVPVRLGLLSIAAAAPSVTTAERLALDGVVDVFNLINKFKRVGC